MSPINVLLAGDQRLVRGALLALLETQLHIVVSREAGSPELLEAVGSVPWDVIVVDLSYAMGGAALLQPLIHRDLGRRIVLVTSGELVPRETQEGVGGVVERFAAPDELLAAVRTVARGEFYDGVPARREAVPGLSQLSPREREVLRYVAAGHTNRATAEELGLSIKTVEGYRARVMRKLDMTTRAELVELARIARLV